jgi:hypothetical protein
VGGAAAAELDRPAQAVKDAPVNASRAHKPSRIATGRRSWLVLRARVIVALALALSGCASARNQFVIVDHREGGRGQRYREAFDEAYYDLDGYGNLELVLRRETGPTGKDPGFEQLIHIRSIWKSIPGETVDAEDQVNAAVAYYLLAGRTGESLEGAGAVFFHENKDRTVLYGSLDLSVLVARSQLGVRTPVFQQVEIRGRFQAVRDPRRVVRLVNQTRARFESSPS